MSGGSEPGGYVRGVYVRHSWNLAFRTPFSVTENDIVYMRSNSTGGSVLGVSSGRPCQWQGVLIQEGLCPGGYVRQSYELEDIMNIEIVGLGSPSSLP